MLFGDIVDLFVTICTLLVLLVVHCVVQSSHTMARTKRRGGGGQVDRPKIVNSVSITSCFY